MRKLIHFYNVFTAKYVNTMNLIVCIQKNIARKFEINVADIPHRKCFPIDANSLSCMSKYHRIALVKMLIADVSCKCNILRQIYKFHCVSPAKMYDTF